MSEEEVDDNEGTVQLVAFWCANHLCYLWEGYQVKVLYITICTEKFQTSAQNRYFGYKNQFQTQLFSDTSHTWPLGQPTSDFCTQNAARANCWNVDLILSLVKSIPGPWSSSTCSQSYVNGSPNMQCTYAENYRWLSNNTQSSTFPRISLTRS